MKIFDNITDIVRDDMENTIKKAARFLLRQLVFQFMHIMS